MNMFNSVPLRSPKRSTFDLSHDKRLSAKMGYLIPILCQECLPSDSFRGSSDMLVRLAPLLAPIYDQIHVYVHYFFVPNRILWDEWEKFITAGQFGVGVAQGAQPIPPQFNVEDVLGFDPLQFTKSQLADYLGVPMLGDLPNAPDPVSWSDAWLDSMPFCVYQKIWYDYYRDRRFIDDDVLSIAAVYPGGMPIQSGEYPAAEIQDWVALYMTLKPRCWKHDYFTSANLEAQLGDQVMIPSTTVNYIPQSLIRTTAGAPLDAAGFFADVNGGFIAASAPDTAARLENIESMGALVEDFRSAYALQVWLERNAIAGSRYTESLQAHFDVRPQDSRLQRPEYIGGGMVPIKISEVVATAWSENATPDSIPQGNMAGHGVTFGNTNTFNYFCPEHGFIMGILSIMNPPSYHQGLPRMFRRTDFLSYPWPTFAKLGEQEVYDFELYAASVNWNSQDPADWSVFGYQSRYAEWKFGRNTSHGDFHDTMLHWSLTSDFGITPILGEEFVQYGLNEEDRIFAVPNADNFWIYLHNNVNARRPLPYFGTPNRLGFE